MQIGIITGMAAEAAAFLPGAMASRHAIGSFEVRALAHAGHTIELIWSGIGKVNAAAAAALLVARGAQLLLVIGTAGKLGDVPGDCFLISSAALGDYGAARDGAFIVYDGGAVPIGPATLSPFVPLPLPADGVPAAAIVTVDCFVQCSERARWLRSTLGADLVDMETAAVAQAAARLGVPWAAIKATTDDANGASASDFAANLAAAAQRSADHAVRAVERIG